MDYASRFWSENEQYHDLAKEYERNIKITHPSKVTYYKYSGALP